MTEPTIVDDSNFDKIVLKSEKLVLVDFWAPWCRPCLMLSPVVEALAQEYSGKIDFTKMNIDENPKTAAKYRIMSIPTLLLFKKGEPVAHVVGFRPKEELKCSLDSALG